PGVVSDQDGEQLDRPCRVAGLPDEASVPEADAQRVRVVGPSKPGDLRQEELKHLDRRRQAPGLPGVARMADARIYCELALPTAHPGAIPSHRAVQLGRQRVLPRTREPDGLGVPPLQLRRRDRIPVRGATRAAITHPSALPVRVRAVTPAPPIPYSIVLISRAA